MTLTISQFFFVSVLMALSGIFVLWIVGTFRAGRGMRRRHALLYACERCRRVYEDHRNVPLSACPSCGTLNQPARR